MARVVAVCGNSIFVVELSDKVYALVNGDSCLFSRYPDSFYKQGYFEEPEEPIALGRKKQIMSAIKDTIDKMTEENIREYCLGSLKKEDVVKAYSG